jgi:hypothetical protein
MLRAQRAIIMKTSKELHPYISVCANIRLLIKEAGLPLDALVAHGRSMMCWRLDNQDGFADSLYSNVGEARHCWRKSSWCIKRLYVVLSLLLVLPIG